MVSGVEMCSVMSLVTEMGRDEKQFAVKQFFLQLLEIDTNSAQKCLGLKGRRVDFLTPKLEPKPRPTHLTIEKEVE